MDTRLYTDTMDRFMKPWALRFWPDGPWFYLHELVLKCLCCITAMDKSKCFLTLKFSIIQTRRDECSAILYQYPVLCPSALITTRIRSGMLSTKLEHVDRGVLSHSSVRNFLNYAMLRGKRCSIRRLRSPHRFSIGLRSGEWGDSLIKLTPLL